MRLSFLLWHNLHVFKKSDSRENNLGVHTFIGSMPFSTTIYLEKETTVVSIFINAKEIAYVNPDIAPKFVIFFNKHYKS